MAGLSRRIIEAMKKGFPYLMLFAALVVSALSIFGDHSYDQLRSLRKSLNEQRGMNANLDATVRGLRREVRGLRSDPAAIERAARDELGMARPDERIYIFERRGGENEKGEASNE